MSSNLYLKLPHRLLQQPTWIRLSDRMKALAIQVALVAGDSDCEADGGRLPPLDDLAVLLRLDPESLETDLLALADVGYMERKNGRWIAAEFMRWQAVETPTAKRMRRLRAKQKYAREQEGVTVTRQSRHPVTPTDPESESHPEPEEARQHTEKTSGADAPGVDADAAVLFSDLVAYGLSESLARKAIAERSKDEIRAAVLKVSNAVATSTARNTPGLLRSILGV
jgi:hypothetical protein